MIRLLCLLAIIFSFNTFALAEGLKPTTYVYGVAKSAYVLGSGSVGSPNSVAQGGVTFSWKSGFYLDLWGSAPFKSNNDNHFGKETDVTAGWKGEMGGLKMDAGIAHYNLYPVSKLDSFDLTDIFGEISPRKAWVVGKESTVTPFFRAEILNSSGRGVKNEVVGYAGLYNNIPLGNSWSLDQKFQVGHQPKLPGLSPGWNGYYKLSLSRALSNKLTVGVIAERYQPFGLDGDRVGKNVYGITFGFPI
ncbi:MAG: TorF family putative porin [Candidatus Paceibacterota bacterium]|jgi:hypothetical protein